MKKAKKLTKSRVATKSEVSVGHKIALGLLVASAFTLGLNFMGMMATPELTRPIIDPEKEPTQHLMLGAINNASTNRLVGMDDDYIKPFFPPTISFYSNQYESKGRLEIDFNNYYPSNNTSIGPLIVKLYHSEIFTVDVPASIITIESGSNSYNLCLPKTSVPVLSGNMYLTAPTYYYDTNGTPYYDILLTQMAIPQPCTENIVRFCADTDGGIEEYVQGTVNNINELGEESFITDVCVGDEVLEYHCDENMGRTASLIMCENGCEDGACILDVVTTCLDTDGGIDQYTQGTVHTVNEWGSESSDTDVCVGDQILEYHCDENMGRTASLIMCENGCEDGACISDELDISPVGIIR